MNTQNTLPLRGDVGVNAANISIDTRDPPHGGRQKQTIECHNPVDGRKQVFPLLNKISPPRQQADEFTFGGLPQLREQQSECLQPTRPVPHAAPASQPR